MTVEEIEIVIVGGGICGLSTAVALHRKGIKSVVLERSETLRASGAAISILTNGWRALHQLGVATKLRQCAVQIQGARDICLQSGKQRLSPVAQSTYSVGEARCLKRSDLITTLAKSLPQGTIRFGCHAISVDLDPLTSFPLLNLSDGSVVKAQILIGCEGANSAVAKFLKLTPQKEFSMWSIRGLTNYPHGHGFAHEFARMRGENNVIIGRIPIDRQMVYWFVSQEGYTKDLNVSKDDSDNIIKLSLDTTKGTSTEIKDMITNSEPSTLSVTQLTYRSPLNILTDRYRRGTVTVAGDAMHAMGPFLGQGGSACLEDAIVLARCLSKKLHEIEVMKVRSKQAKMDKVGEAFDEYVKIRRMRLVKLSTITYLTGLFLTSSSSPVKFLIIFIMTILFSDLTQSQYDCGEL